MLALTHSPEAVLPICKLLEKLSPPALGVILKQMNTEMNRETSNNALMLALTHSPEAVLPICQLLEKLSPPALGVILKQMNRESSNALMLALTHSREAVLPICKQLAILSFEDLEFILLQLRKEHWDMLIPIALNCPPFAKRLSQYRDLFDCGFRDGPRFEAKVFSAFSEAMDKTSVPSSVTAPVAVTVQGGAGGPILPHPEPESSSGPERPSVLESGLYFALRFRNPSFFAECLNQGANFWGNLDKCMAILFGLERQITSSPERGIIIKNLDNHVGFEHFIQRRQEFLHQCERFFVVFKPEEAQAKTVFVLLLIIQACENYEAHKILGNGSGGLTHKTYKPTVYLKNQIKETLTQIESSEGTISEGTVESKIATAKNLFTESPWWRPTFTTTGFKEICLRDVEFAERVFQRLSAAEPLKNKTGMQSFDIDMAK